jgi:hypothetical protein
MTQQQIYVGLLDEGVPVWRPVAAIEVSPGVFVILAPGLARHGTSHESCHENSKFVPGELVRCDTRALSGANVLVAVSRYQEP